MIRLTLFGSVDLVREDGAAVLSILAQPKRLALLAYLGAARPAGFHRRDALAALFWPDLGDRRARANLRKGLHRIRRSLGEEVLLLRGDEEVALDPERLRCDVGELRSLVGEGEYEAALALYKGPLMSGFHANGARPFMEWLDEERAALRQEALRAAETLARARLEAGDAAGATEAAARATALDPLSERAVQVFMEAADRSGDRAGALAAYDAFAERLSSEFGAEPSPETRATVAAVRAREVVEEMGATEGGHGSDGDAAGEEDAPGGPLRSPDASTRHPRPVIPEERTRGWTGRTKGNTLFLTAGAVTLVAAAVAVTVAGGPGIESDHGRRTEDSRVLVAAFENRTGDPALDPVGELAADWVTRGLQESGLAAVVDPLSALLAARRASADSAAPHGLDRAARTAREAGAALVVWGAIYQRGDSLHFTPQVTDVEADRLLVSLDPVVAPATDPLAGAEELRKEVGGALASVLDRRVASLGTATRKPPTLQAYRRFIAGLEAFQESRLPVAAGHFEAAARLDTTFMLPLIWGALVHEHHGNPQARDSLVAVLASRRNHLGPLDQAALDYFLAWERGDLGGKGAAARRAADLAPGSEWDYQASNVALALNRPRQALAHLEKIDSEHGWAGQWFPYWRNFYLAHHLLDQHEAELKAALRFRELAPTSSAARWSEIAALVGLGRLAAAERALREALLLPARPGTVPGQGALSVASEMYAHGHHDRAREILEAAEAWFLSPAADAHVRVSGPSERVWVRIFYGETLYALGRLEEAEEHFKALARETGIGAAHAYLGLIAARRGDRAGAEQAIRRHAGSAHPRGGSAFSGNLVPAQIAAVLGDHERAVKLLRAALGESSPRTYILLHRGRDWDNLRGYPPFDRIVQPRG